MVEQTADILVVLSNDEKGSGRDERKHPGSSTLRLENPRQQREESHSKDRGERYVTEHRKIPTKIASITRTVLGVSAIKEPSPVATPLPPRKRSHTGNI